MQEEVDFFQKFVLNETFVGVLTENNAGPVHQWELYNQRTKVSVAKTLLVHYQQNQPTVNDATGVVNGSVVNNLLTVAGESLDAFELSDQTSNSLMVQVSSPEGLRKKIATKNKYCFCAYKNNIGEKF